MNLFSKDWNQQECIIIIQGIMIKIFGVKCYMEVLLLIYPTPGIPTVCIYKHDYMPYCNSAPTAY